MFNCIYLIDENFNKNKRNYVRLQNGIVEIQCKSKKFGSRELKDLLSTISFVKNVYKKACKEIRIVIPRFEPLDKMVYILIESLIYTLIYICGYKVDFRIQRYNCNINTAGILNTVLLQSAIEGTNYNIFKKKFLHDIGPNHFRRVLLNPLDDTAPSLLVTEIKTFLYKYHAKENFDKELAMVIGELVDNAFDHAKTGCLIDIDITNASYGMVDDVSEKDYYAVNVCVINLGKKCIYNDMSDKILNKEYENSERYDAVLNAYEYHKNFFSKEYDQNTFFLISSFQDEISGRKNEINSGGKGLPELIKNLEEYAAENFCYALSGNTGIFFEKNVLCYTQDGWIGFNNSNDFINDIPNNEIVFKSTTYLPGTGYNFMLVFEGE